MADPNVQATIADWQAKGVVTYVTLTEVEVPFYREMNIWPQWVLDTKNGKMAQKYLNLAEIPSSAYTMALPSGLDACDDFLFCHMQIQLGKTMVTSTIGAILLPMGEVRDGFGLVVPCSKCFGAPGRPSGSK